MSDVASNQNVVLHHLLSDDQVVICHLCCAWGGNSLIP